MQHARREQHEGPGSLLAPRQSRFLLDCSVEEEVRRRQLIDLGDAGQPDGEIGSAVTVAVNLHPLEGSANRAYGDVPFQAASPMKFPLGSASSVTTRSAAVKGTRKTPPLHPDDRLGPMACWISDTVVK